MCAPAKSWSIVSYGYGMGGCIHEHVHDCTALLIRGKRVFFVLYPFNCALILFFVQAPIEISDSPLKSSAPSTQISSTAPNDSTHSTETTEAADLNTNKHKEVPNKQEEQSGADNKELESNVSVSSSEPQPHDTTISSSGAESDTSSILDPPTESSSKPEQESIQTEDDSKHENGFKRIDESNDFEKTNEKTNGVDVIKDESANTESPAAGIIHAT